MRMLPRPPHPGEGAEYKDLQAVGQQVTFDFWMRFKLGRLADWAGMLMTRHRAPSAAIRIRLTMRSSGSAFVTFIFLRHPESAFLHRLEGEPRVQHDRL